MTRSVCPLYSAWPYFRASFWMCSQPPSVVIEITRPRTATFCKTLSLSKAHIAMRGSLSRFLGQLRLWVELRRMSSPSSSTQAMVTLGPPSRPRVDTAARLSFSKNSRWSGGIDAIRSPCLCRRQAIDLNSEADGEYPSASCLARNSGRVLAELLEGPFLDLTYAFARQAHTAPDLVEGLTLAVGQAKAQLEDQALPLLQLGQRFQDIGWQPALGLGIGAVGIGDEVGQRVALFVDLEVQRGAHVRQTLEVIDLGDVKTGRLGDLPGLRVTTKPRRERLLGSKRLGAHLVHVNGQPDRKSLVGQRALDRLANPPGRVCRELATPAVVELVDGPEQAEVTLLDQVREGQAAPLVALGDGHDQPGVGLNQVPARALIAILGGCGEH